jgi:hypothetical protein
MARRCLFDCEIENLVNNLLLYYYYYFILFQNVFVL